MVLLKYAHQMRLVQALHLFPTILLDIPVQSYREVSYPLLVVNLQTVC